jgi:AraC-like DNA-binding protein
MIRGEPLSRFRVVGTTKTGSMKEALGLICSKPSIEISGRGQKVHASINSCHLQHIALTYSKFSGVRLDFREARWFTQVIPLKGRGEFVLARTAVSTGPERGVVISPGLNFRMNFDGGQKQLSMRIDPGALARLLTAINGSAVVKPLKMEPIQDFASPQARVLRDLILLVVDQLSRADEKLPDLVLAELEQGLMVAYLFGNRHNYSRLLQREPSAIASRQVRRVEEYIEANWAQPITIEDIAAVAGTSARSVFRTFRQSRGLSPMTFVKQTRLKHSQRLLQFADSTTTVKDVAFTCGFSHVGRFSRDYYRAFGELPSATLMRAQ